MKKILLMTAIIFSSNIFAENSYYIVIKNKKAIKFSKNTLRNIFLGYQTHWEDGMRIKPMISNIEGASIQSFLREVCQMGARDFLNHWRRKLFSGNGVPPKKFSFDEDVLSKVMRNKNAIGVVENKSDAYKKLIYIPFDDLSYLNPSKAHLVTHTNK